MSDNEFEPTPDNDWDDTWELAWSEFDWERYLRDQDDVIGRYLSHYERMIDRPDRIDEVAHLMGWDQDGWTNDESEGTGGNHAVASPESPVEPDPAAVPGALDPYTIQKHPVYISTHALFTGLQQGWEFLVPVCATLVPARSAVGFAVSLAKAEHCGLLATHSLDMGDFSLAVSQVKRALTNLNAGLRHLELVEDRSHPALVHFRGQALVRIFDIREIWLRVMRDCRDELKRRVGDGDI
jgi:hypothetical protein